MRFELPPLPYGFGDLEPVISKESLTLHYEDLQQAYVDKLNAFPSIAELPNTATLEKVMFAGAKEPVAKDPFALPQQPDYDPLFNMAAQVWNHTFFWNSLSPEGGGEPTGVIADGIRINYGTFEKFRETMRRRALGLFGSGWIWLGMREGDLWVLEGRNAAMPLIYGISPILCIDMWEHAYYLDYKTDRGAYFDEVMNNLINWEFANQNIQHAAY
jgi:Fe-Mn family superoxide dismutase